VTRWQRYWFAEGGRYTVAVLRLAIAVSVLFCLWRLWGLRPLTAAADVYRPVGIWMVLGQTPPPDLLVDALWALAWAGTGAMLLGLSSRISTAVSFVASSSLAALSFSGRLSWSHQYNVVFLAQAALLGARCGDVLSVDALIRRLRGRPSLSVTRGYQWSVRLVMLAVSMMFVGAALHKIGNGQFTLRWALSDNLRNQLLVRYDLTGIERPEIVEWLLAESWRYRGAALLNLLTQLSPLLAIALPHRPLVRAFAGALFVAEVLGLGFVMQLWNLPWLPLAAVYIDWDRLIGFLRRAPRRDMELEMPPRRPVRLFVIAFVVYDLATSLIPTIDQRLNTFPFTSFPMFAKIRAAQPYDEHLPYAVPGDAYEAISDRAISPEIQHWLDYQNRNLHTVQDPAKVRARLADVLARAQARYPDAKIRGMRHYVALFVAPSYPAAARLERHPIAITGELLPDGTFRTLLGSLTATGVELRPQNLDASAARLVYFAGDRPVPIPLGGTRTGNTVAVALDADPVYVAAEVGGVRWLVAWRRSWRWD
jgi:hypothetical protein